MILSHKHKFLFLHNRKAAGTSISFILSKYCSNQDIVTPCDESLKNNDSQRAINYLFDDKPFILDLKVNNILNRLKSNLPQIIKSIPMIRNSNLITNRNIHYEKLFFIPNLKYTTHSNIDDLIKYYKEDYLNKLFKFAVYRNPWDQMISLYLNRGQILSDEDGNFPKKYRKKKVDFKTFVKFQAECFFQDSINHFFSKNIKLDKIFYFDSIADDFKNYFPTYFSYEIYLYLKNNKHNVGSKRKNIKKDEFIDEEIFNYILAVSGNYGKISKIYDYKQYLEIQ